MIRTIGTLVRHVPPYLRYGAVSVVALGIDMWVLLLLVTAGLLPALASGFSYLIGMIVHWLLSSRFVFGDDLAAAGAGRSRQQGLFFASALAGLVLTMAIVGLGDWLGIDTRLAKLAAVAVSFNATYLMRRKIVFA